jgi:hypothetical protein
VGVLFLEYWRHLPPSSISSQWKLTERLLKWNRRLFPVHESCVCVCVGDVDVRILASFVCELARSSDPCCPISPSWPTVPSPAPPQGMSLLPAYWNRSGSRWVMMQLHGWMDGAEIWPSGIKTLIYMHLFHGWIDERMCVYVFYSWMGWWMNRRMNVWMKPFFFFYSPAYHLSFCFRIWILPSF